MNQAEIRPNVLAIDDMTGRRLLMARALEDSGYSVSGADNGEQAIAAIQAERPDLVLLDAAMPGLDSFATCRKIRALAGAAHLPILMLTALDDDESISLAYDAGATDFFVKSDRWAVLAQRMRHLLHASRVHSDFAQPDITEKKRAEDQIRLLANYDGLTGLANRRLFHDQFARAIELARPDVAPVALLVIDLDRLRQINNNLGHAAGDQLLMEVALRLNQAIRDRGLKSASADLVARLGGDEFAIVLTGLSGAGEAEAVAQCIQAALRRPIRLAGQECVTSASIGIAAYPRDGDDAETLMRYADVAMNAAKASGMNALQVYKPKLIAASKQRLVLEQALHKALGRNELVMHYQPQINTRLGRIVGAEALMRWQCDGRLVPPGEFINIAEEIGLIVAFGEWAIGNVVSQNRAWVDDDFDPLPIAVNIPGCHFERSNFVDLVQKTLTHQCIAAKYLELEITETTLMRDLASTLPTLDALTALGIRLSVDDFGTGYSSLSYLRRLPIDTLKIDGSFVRDLKRGSDNEAIVAAIIAMAKSLNLRVIAEGVETHEQMSLLQAHGCHIMQGYYFSKPVPAADFARFRRQYSDQQPLPKLIARDRRRAGGPRLSLVASSH